MTDLYSVLGIPKTASKAEIRQAYRNAAKKAHPDNQETGNVKKFAMVKLAHDVLTDCERRKQYDETGEYGEKEPDNGFSDTINLLSTALDQVMNDINQSGGLEFLTGFNLVQRMKDALVQQKKTAMNHKDNIDKIRRLNVRLEKRFRRRFKSSEPNHLENMVRGRIALCKDQLEFQERMIKRVDESLALLSEYEFDTEIGKTAPPPARMSTLEAMLRGSFLGEQS
jgi:DnaJ-class molecular chaperone